MPGLRWKIQNPFKTKKVHLNDDVAGQFGFGAPLQVSFKRRPLPPVDNAGSYAYQTYLSPRYTPIGGGIPNQRDIGCAPPAVSRQGVLVVQVGSPGILAGSFVSGPLTNVDSTQASQPIPNYQTNSFALPPN